MFNKQAGKTTVVTTALHYRTASYEPCKMHLDNQMHKLLCYANEQTFCSFPKGGGKI